MTDGHWEEHFGPKCGTPKILGHHQKEPGQLLLAGREVNLKDRRSNFSLTVNWSPHSFGHDNVQTLLVAQPSNNRKSTHFSSTALLQKRKIFYA